MEQEALGRLVARLRKERGLTQGQLATYARVTRSWLSLVEGDRIDQPDREMLESVATVLKVAPETLWAAAGYRVTPLPERPRSTAELLAELQARFRHEEEERIRLEEEHRRLLATPGRVLRLPETTQPASAGTGAPGVAEWYYTPPPELEGHLFLVVPVVGDCMEPRIMQGHRVIVDKNASPRPGDIVVADHEGEYVVKILEERHGEHWLVATKAEYAPIKVNGHTRIEGVVVDVVYRP